MANETFQDKLTRLTDENAGAMTVLGILAAVHGERVIDLLDNQKISGKRLWLLYADVCKKKHQDLVALLEKGTAAQELSAVEK